MVEGTARTDPDAADLRGTWWVDVGIAAALTFAAVMGVIHIDPESGDRPVDWLTITLVAVAGASMVLRRHAPLVALVVVAVVLGVYAIREHPGGPVYLLGPIALFSFMVRHPRRTAWGAAAIVLVWMIVARSIAGDGVDAITLLWVGWVLAATLGSEVARGRLEQRRLAEIRREEAASHQSETMRRQLVEERLRIARDLHDSVAHSMATINVQAGVAAHVIEQRPLDARAALEVIRSTSEEVLDELAAMLTLLRSEGDADSTFDDGAAPRQPAADLTRLDGLVESSRLAGLDVELLVGDVQVADVSPAISTSAYRIVQEALTNVIRHAGSDTASVAVLRPPEGGLVIEVRDDGGGTAHGRSSATSDPGVPATPGSGMGLVGIRERAEATGGRVEIGPRPGGGFQVRVVWR